MPIITNREAALEVIERFRLKGVSMAVFATSTHWNTEAILLAASQFAEHNGVRDVAVGVCMTFITQHMGQACRMTYSRDPKAGFISNMEHLKALCASVDSPYADVIVLPHLDHAHPEKDRWALTKGLPYLASVMFDVQDYSWEDRLRLTHDYVRTYGKKVMVEGIVDQIAVEGGVPAGNEQGEVEVSNGVQDSYLEQVKRFVAITGVDFVVPNLGGHHGSKTAGAGHYLKEKARAITMSLGEPKLVLHGTSSLNLEQMRDLANDGIVRVNMWTRIARESGQRAAEALVHRLDAIRTGDIAAADSCQYLEDLTVHAAELMEKIMDVLGYGKL